MAEPLGAHYGTEVREPRGATVHGATIFVVCDDGTLWRRAVDGSGAWVRLDPPIPGSPVLNNPTESGPGGE